MIETTKKCKECNKAITEKEYNNFSGYCYQCYEKIRIKKEKAREWLETLPPKFQKIQNKEAEKYLGESLFIFGQTNTGKTVLATSILKLNWQEGNAGEYIKFTELITQLQFTDNEKRLSLLDKVSKMKGLLVLDDFGGIGKVTDFVRQISYYIISYREENELPTIITSNLSLDELGQQIDIRISSRIKRSCKILELKKKMI